MASKIENQYNLKEDYAELVIIAKNYQKTVLLDLDDVKKVKQCMWHIVFDKNSLRVCNNKTKGLNHFIFNKEVKHVYYLNGNPLDNRKNNLVEEIELSKKLQKGQKFNKLTVIKLNHIKTYISPQGQKENFEYYLCQCDCGKQKVIEKNKLVQGYTKSCGCLLSSEEHKKLMSEVSKTHGYSKTKIYHLFFTIKERCYNPKSSSYSNYGARGIKMCDEWLNNPLQFIEWALSQGYDEAAAKGEYTIDRIDVNGNYEPNNCRFVTIQEQSKNRRGSLIITYMGETKPLGDWCRMFGLHPSTIRKRFLKGWDAERAFNEPIRKNKSRDMKNILKRKNKEQNEQLKIDITGES